MKVALITGATQGIGKQVAVEFAQKGITVILLGRNVRLLEEVYDEIPNSWIYPFNLSSASSDDYIDLANIITKKFGRLDFLIHNAATLGSLTPVEHIDIETWYNVWQTNFHSAFLLTKFCIPILKKTKDSNIVFTLDKQAEELQAYWSPYSLTKKAIHDFMETLKKELTNTSSVQVHGIYPEQVNTRLSKLIFPARDISRTPKDVMQPYLDLIT